MREQRRSRRILASVPLEVRLSDDRVRRALTAVINLNGALILSPVDWPPDTNLTVRNPNTGLVIYARVVWCGSQTSKGSYKLGIEFQAPSPEFWGESYDPLGIEVR
jgi:hypothetical protein